MCSNFQAITKKHADWVKKHFQCELPYDEWREEIYPAYAAPFIWHDGEKISCELAKFGLVPAWAANKPKFGLRTYNARSETVAEKPSYSKAWKRRQFGLALMQSFYEPNYESGKAVRWRIKRKDAEPIAAASIWERYIDHQTGEIIFTFSMLTVNATNHQVMQHFHRPEDEKRSIVVLQNDCYPSWLNTDLTQARNFLIPTPDDLLQCEPAPR